MARKVDKVYSEGYEPSEEYPTPSDSFSHGTLFVGVGKYFFRIICVALVLLNSHQKEYTITQTNISDFSVIKSTTPESGFGFIDTYGNGQLPNIEKEKNSKMAHEKLKHLRQ